MSFHRLDRVSGEDVIERFQKAEPALSGYLHSNVEDHELRVVLSLVGLALISDENST